MAQDKEKNIKNQKDDNIDHKEKIQYKIDNRKKKRKEEIYLMTKIIKR